MNSSIKKFLNLNFVNIKKVPFTIIFSIISVILFSIMELFEHQYILDKILYFCILSSLMVVNTLLTEVLFTSKRKRIFGYILSFIIANVICLVSYSNLLFMPLCDSIYCFANISDNAVCFTLCYILSMLSISIFIIYKKSKLDFFEYMNIVLNNIFKTLIVSTVSLICISFILVLLTMISDIDYKFINLIYLLLGLYFLPNFIISFIDTKAKINNIYRGIGLFCILPLTIICTLIIYFYIFRLLIIKELPDNLIFALVLFVFIFGMISFFVSKSIDNKLSKIYCNIFPYIFVLPVVLQSYSLFVRISEYGLTPDRYISYMIIVLELIVLFLLAYKKGIKLENVLISIVIISIIISISPFNLIKLPNISQQEILNENYNKSGQDYYKAIGAYEYLIDSEGGKKYITDEINKKMENAVMDKKCTSDYKSYHFSISFDEIDISKYKSLKKIIFSYSYDKDDINNIEILNKKEKNTEITIDLNNYLNYLISNNYLTREMFETNNIIKIDDNAIIYLDYLYLKTSKTNNYDIRNSRGTGYLLEK